jgi:indole-3-glycerol phosphate synthase
VSPLAAILRQIVENRRREVEAEAGKSVLPQVQAEAGGLVDNRFAASLRKHRGRGVIAEVKMGSPRIGSLRGRLDPLRQAAAYARDGAAALSVVVEPEFFFGSYELLAACRRASGLPTLAKDFIVHPMQLEWARQAGADAVLLIAALFSTTELKAYAGHARSLGLVPVVETHDQADVAILADQPWEVVGVNNRDLETFEVDLEQSMKMVSSLPEHALKVSESGIARPRDVERLAKAGFDAFLVGETLLLADDPGAKLRELMGGG